MQDRPTPKELTLMASMLIGMAAMVPGALAVAGYCQVTQHDRGK
jgi:hypothetical protein